MALLSLLDTIAAHAVGGRRSAVAHEHETELFHMARSSYLRQRLAKIAPHRLTPDRKGHA